jgi:serine protease
LLFLLLPSLLAACGGGGGGGGNNADTTNPVAPLPSNEAPVASFTLDKSSGNAPLLVTVDASASRDADGTVAAYSWDFDGVAAIGSIAQYTFEQPGTYTITLTVTDEDAATDTTARTVTVNTAGALYNVTGTVRILSSTAVDTDVNDRLTTPVSNNTFADAQNLPTPATLGGFANTANTGEPTGNLFTSGDPADFYRVSLIGDEVIALSIAESGADLDLRLWNESQALVDASITLAQTETIQVPAPGTYFIEVLPAAGASNYVLYVGQDAGATVAQRKAGRLSDPFIPGELIVKHHPTALQALTEGALAHPTQRGEQGLPPRLQTLARSKDHASVSALYGVTAVDAHIGYATLTPEGGSVTDEQVLRLQTLSMLKQVQQQTGVAYAELNMRVTTHATPNDRFYGSQWHYPAINLPLAWDTTRGANGVIVAVVDTGVLLDHPDLDGRLIAGYDFISDRARARDGGGIDPNPNDEGDLQYGGSSSFHGTHVAGTVGAETNNRTGSAGTTWQTRIMPLRALGVGGGSTFDIIQAVRYAAGLSNSSGTLPAQRADIINLSVGTTFSSQSEQDTYLQAFQAGVIVVASAGNDASAAPSYPAAYQGVVSVAATTITNERANYSNFGSQVDVAAPGGSTLTDLNGDGIADGVISTSGDDSGAAVEFGYATLAGTSMAAPHVAGVAALMKAVYPPLTPAQFDAALAAGDLTDDLGAPGRDDYFGYGLINAQKAILAAQQLASGQGTDPGPILSASASTLNFGSFLNELNITLLNIGSGDIDITQVSADADWVTVIPPGSSDGLGTYRITIDRSGLSDGAYQARLTFTSTANESNVSLIMQVSQQGFSANAGLFYIILVDANGDTAAQDLVTANAGEYRFSFDAVNSAQYRLFAGSDADDDAILCDAGEACGAYPTLDSPEFIAINGDRSGLDFESSFRATLSVDSTGGTQTQEQALPSPTPKLRVAKPTKETTP